MRKRWGIFCLLVTMLCSLSACGGVPADKSQNADSAAKITSGDAIQVSSRKAQEVSLERKDCKVDLQIPAKKQIGRIYQEKLLWYWEPKNAQDDDADLPEFAVTDFDQDGYLEIFVLLYEF